MPTPEEAFATRLRAQLASRALNLRQLADHVGVHENTVAKWANGAQGPKFEHLIALARVLDVSVAELVMDPPAPQPLPTPPVLAAPIADRLVHDLAVALRRTVSVVGAVAPDLLRVLSDAEAHVARLRDEE